MKTAADLVVQVLADAGVKYVFGISGDSVLALIDAILAKCNLGTRKNEAPLVIGLGPGFTAGVDCHLVIETNRGHDLGRIIACGSAEPNTGIPGDIAGHTDERVLRAPAAGIFESQRAIGDSVAERVVGRIARDAGLAVAEGRDGDPDALGRLQHRHPLAGFDLSPVDRQAELAHVPSLALALFLTVRVW